jgi:siroheme synthase-like protein
MAADVAHPGLPIALHLRGKRAVVVGSDAGADDRAARAAAAGADVIRTPAADYRAEALAGAAIVFAQTGDPARDAAIAGDARAAGALGYAADQPAASDFSMPAVAARGPLKLAVSTDGVAPALARRLREELDRLLAAAGTALDALLAELAARRSALPPGERRGPLAALAARLHLDGTIRID